jgi:peptidoglycan hydrolase-like protein with peptidoglycan-binding domain
MQLKRIAIAAAAALALTAPAIAAGDRHSQSHDSSAAGPGATGQEMDSQTVRLLQQALQGKGHDVGGVDGIMGPRTQSALRQYQQAHGMPATGRLDQQTVSSLGLSSGGMNRSGAGSTGSSMNPGSTGSSGAGTTGSSSGGTGSASTPRPGG